MDEGTHPNLIIGKLQVEKKSAKILEKIVKAAI